MSRSKFPVLLVDDEKQILLSYSVMLRAAGVENIKTVCDSRKVMSLLAEEDVSVIVLDLNMPYISGISLLEQINDEFPHAAVIIMTAMNDLNKAVDCMKLGAVDYLVKPVEKSRFISSITRAMELKGLRDEVSSLREHISSLRQHIFSDALENEAAFSSYLTNSRKMRAIFQYVETIAKSTEPVLITGETGVGKELLSKAVHDISDVQGELVAVNVAGLDDTMFSDTLFGHKKGAFTGADKNRKGLIEKATDGTLLLDEIGDLSELSQVKLLRLLEQGVYYPLGSDTISRSNARIIASTNRNLQKQIIDGNFRKDLYYRLAALQVQIPPLSERPEDIPVLLDYFLADSAKSLKKKKPSIPPELISLLLSYYFPGNVRELKAMAYHAVANHKRGVLSMNQFKKFIENEGGPQKPCFPDSSNNDKAAINISGRFPTFKEVEDYLIAEALKQANGNQGIAASLLGISRHALNKRLKRKNESQ
jgi:DNA-binding NtrC family response regulator